MKRILPLLAVAASLILSSCGASKFYSLNETGVHPMALVQPFSYLTDAVGDFTTDFIPAVSQANNELLSETISAVNLPVERIVPFDYNYANKSDATVRWMRQLADTSPGSARKLVVPAAILDAVKASGCRYGMVLTDIGYVKNASQYNLERGLEIGTKAVDFLLNNSLDLSKETEAYINGMFSLIFDAQTGEVVWFGARPRDYKHNPLEPADIRDQVTKLYKDFLK